MKDRDLLLSQHLEDLTVSNPSIFPWQQGKIS